MFSDDFLKPGTSEKAVYENTMPTGFSSGFTERLTPWKTNRVCRWHSSLSVYFYINLPGTLTKSVPAPQRS